MPFACIFVSDFPVEAVLCAEPGLRSHPVAVLEGKAPLQKIFALNRNARAMGLEPGMTRLQVEHCAGLALRPRSVVQESAAHDALLACAQGFSPRVEDAAADTLLLDLAGLESLFGSPDAIAQALALRVSESGMEAHVAVAANADTAVIAARGFPGVNIIAQGEEAERLGNLPVEVLFVGGVPQRLKSSSSGQADRRAESVDVRNQSSLRDSGSCPVFPGAEAPGYYRDAPPGLISQTSIALNPPELRSHAHTERAGPSYASGVQRGLKAGLFRQRCGEDRETEQLLETFERWGVRNLNDLAALPEVALSERLGQEGVFLQQLARGAISRGLFAVEELPVFEKEVELEHPLVLLEPLAFLLSQLLEEICARLEAYAFATQELTLLLELGDTYFDDAETERVEASRRHFTRTLNLPVPLLDARVFLKLLQLDLNANPPGAPIRKIYLAAKPVRPRAAQGGLFLPPAPEPEKLELTLARIAGIVGERKLGSVELLDTYRREGFRMRRFAPREPQEAKDKGEEDALALRYCRAGLSHDAASRLSSEERFTSSAKARVDSRLGGTSETRALPGASHMQNFPPVAEAEFTAQTQACHSVCGLVTALRIFRPPVRATITIREGKPDHIVCPKREVIQGAILWTAGPWRSSGDWWEREGWTRDEWDIAVQEKSGIAMYRLVRDLLGGQWVVEGVYD